LLLGPHILNTYYSAFAPRIGAAYQLDQNTVLRAYYGIERYPLMNINNGGIGFPGDNLGWGATVSSNSLDNGVTPAFNWNSGFPVSLPPLPDLDPSLVNGSSVAYVDPKDNKSGMNQNIGLGVERAGLPGGISVRVDYVGKLLQNAPNPTLIGLNQLDPKYLGLGSLLLANINFP
jgi:hypothetical protein